MSNADAVASGDTAGSGLRPDAEPAPASLVYLDHAATTPVVPAALAAMTDELALLGNPSSLHNAGRRARRVVEGARGIIAQAYRARPREAGFTSGRTRAGHLPGEGLY